MPDSPRPSRFRVIVDADACVPPEVRAALNIAVTPAEPELLLDRVPIPRLALERGPFEAADIAAACAAAAEPGEGVLYIRTGDGHGSPDDAPEAARAAVEARGATFHLVETEGALMGAGWAAIVAAEVARDGGDIETAAAAARGAAGRTRVMAMLEHPEVVGLIAPSLYVTPARMVTTLDGTVVTTLAALPKRPDALIALRDRFAIEVRAEGGRPRVAILHSSSGPAAEAMAQWGAKHLDLAEVVIAPITRHEGARLGPGFLALAWLRAE